MFVRIIKINSVSFISTMFSLDIVEINIILEEL